MKRIISKKFAKDLQEQKENFGYSYDAIANETGLRKSVVYKAMIGGNPSLETYHALCKWMGKTICEYVK